jgi:CubicO group peptidase (beta-lactamase class C family)
LRLASAGRLKLEEPMAPYWTDPDIAQDPRSKKLTARMCLEHETGFPNWRYQTGDVLKFKAEPGTAFGYSGEGFNYIARYAEKRTGEGFEQLAQETVLGPMGMKDTSYTPRAWWAGRQANPVETGDRTKWSGADLLRTTVGDYARFVVGVMHDGAVSPEIAKERMTIHRELTTPEEASVMCEAARDAAHCAVQTGIGLGWRVVKLNGETILDHTGGDADVRTFAFLVPERGVGAVIFTNGPDVGNAMIAKVLAVLYPDPVYAETLWPVK